MGLVQVSTATVTSAVASITLTGLDSDNTYMIYMNNVVSASDDKNLYISGSDTQGGHSSIYSEDTGAMIMNQWLSDHNKVYLPTYL